MIKLSTPLIGDEELQAVGDVLRSGFLVQGKHVLEFEQRVAAYLQVKHAIAVSSGTAALHLALLALEIGPGDEVIVPDFTFPATANVVALMGATPILVDIDLDTFNIDVAQAKQALSAHTKAIMPVHLFGQAANMAGLQRLSDDYGVPIIEDAACALGAEYRGQKCGTLGEIACFSFHPRKVITTGEGGMVVTNADWLAERVRRLRNHGMTAVNGRQVFEFPGLNYRLTDFQGAMGIVQMQRLPEIILQRRTLATCYQEALADLPNVKLPLEAPDSYHIWQSYVILLQGGIDRDYVLAYLRSQGIEAGIGTYAVSAQPSFAHVRYDLPNSSLAFRQSVSLPCHQGVTVEQVKYIAEQLRCALRDIPHV